VSRIKPGLAHRIVEELPAIDQAGNVSRVVNFVVTPEEDEQIRQGYRCPFDMQVFREPFPDKCPICALTPEREWFSPKKHQIEVYEAGHQGEQQYGPTPIEETDYEQELWKPSDSRIWVPRSTT
jgi:hypothetical protein